MIRIKQDKERARSILGMIDEREKVVKKLDEIGFSTIIAENYYEIIKELCTAIALTEGFKFVGDNSHKELIEFMKKNKEITEGDVSIMDDLRIRRNKSSYEGRKIEIVYLENNKESLLEIIGKLKKVLKKKLEEDEV